MNVTYVIPPHELGKFERKFAQKLRLEQQKMLRQAGQQAVALLRAKTADVRDLGGYQNGWRAVAQFNRVEIKNVAPNTPFVEDGRRAGAAQPPIAAIMGWVLRHIGDARAAYPIARAIARRGIKARRAITDPATLDQMADFAAAAARDAWRRAARGAL